MVWKTGECWSQEPRQSWRQDPKAMGGGDFGIVESNHLEVVLAISNPSCLAWVVSVESGVAEGEANDGEKDPEVEVLIEKRGARFQAWRAMFGQRPPAGSVMAAFSVRRLALARCLDAWPSSPASSAA